ncbi:hypothetical protein [Caldisericum sp.]|uniref:hypothetical protein n=1 Tax=Caldisericum sp. TaxID=2499687 RepID=UPI003D0D4203
MKRDYRLFLKDIIDAMEAIERFVEGMELTLGNDKIRNTKTKARIKESSPRVRKEGRWIKDERRKEN